MTRSTILIGGLAAVCLLIIALAAVLTPPPDPLVIERFRLLGRERLGGIALARFPFLFGPFGLHRPGAEGLVGKVAGLAFVYLSWTALLFLLPERIGRMAAVMAPSAWRGPGRLFAIGLAGLAAATLLNLLGFYTLVGIPVSLALALILTLVVYVGLSGLAFGLGRAIRYRLGRQTGSPLLDLALGTLVIYALGAIPVAGWLVVGAASVYAFGAVVVTRFGSTSPGQPWSLQALEPGAQEESSDRVLPAD